MKTIFIVAAAACFTVPQAQPAENRLGKNSSNRSLAGAGGEAEIEVQGRQEGNATILHRDEVLRDRGGGKHLWPLLHTSEARVNYFEVTGRGPLHFHPDADHRLYVLEGTVLVTCGSTTTKCNAGDFIIIPKGAPHCYDVPTAGTKALLLTFDAPPYDPKKTVNLAEENNRKTANEP